MIFCTIPRTYSKMIPFMIPKIVPNMNPQMIPNMIQETFLNMIPNLIPKMIANMNPKYVCSYFYTSFKHTLTSKTFWVSRNSPWTKKCRKMQTRERQKAYLKTKWRNDADTTFLCSNVVCMFLLDSCLLLYIYIFFLEVFPSTVASSLRWALFLYTIGYAVFRFSIPFLYFDFGYPILFVFHISYNLRFWF